MGNPEQGGHGRGNIESGPDYGDENLEAAMRQRIDQENAWLKQVLAIRSTVREKLAEYPTCVHIDRAGVVEILRLELTGNLEITSDIDNEISTCQIESENVRYRASFNKGSIQLTRKENPSSPDRFDIIIKPADLNSQEVTDLIEAVAEAKPVE